MMFIFWQVAGGNGGERVVTDSKDDREKGVAWVAWKKFGLRKKIRSIMFHPNIWMG